MPAKVSPTGSSQFRFCVQIADPPQFPFTLQQYCFCLSLVRTHLHSCITCRLPPEARNTELACREQLHLAVGDSAF
ncbi:unnamed protein product [Protopolystoma xenopodis]|uniref:Uncharacterized protein n=1 Tax=Protopolystoma xenopodis TaxID=117903 RepID=A0A3S5BTY3_9PLAT|nr:unnamed protein product [Protopolystoma xenopodis]